MIIEFILIAIMNVFAWVLSYLNFIQIDRSIMQGLASAVDFMMYPFGVIVNYVGGEFLAQILLILMVVYPIVYTWVIVEWIVVKLHVLGGH